MDIYLQKALLQIVDRNQGEPVCSAVELDLTTEYVREYLTKKINGLSSGQTKLGQLKHGSAFVEYAKRLTADFAESAASLTQHWYQTYQESEDGPSCDVFICLYEADTELYLAFFKVNFHDAYTHYVEGSEAGIENQLILHRAILSGKTQKADEGLLLKLSDLSYQLIEKKYTFSGEKRFYFSTAVLESAPLPSLDENVKVIKKVAEKIGEKFATPKYDIVAEVKEAVFTSISETGVMQVEDIAEKVFHDNFSAKTAFKEEVLEKGFVDEAPIVEEIKKQPAKKFGKQKLKLSNGIELIVPVEVYKNPDLIEFINNPDGTISVTIKNVEEVINRL
ncbi:nucleoid-associated protein [Enterococcus nangangensis]|uniref:nucleoid-associated protein n=1 Tax=Enterococcus nangangensis TaxID=2559926 RepID=UPI0010F993E6|nr:nucleoid-associated protein [Enterococcus nangangensis]